MTTAAVQRVCEHRADAADTYGPLVTNPRKVEQRGAGEHVGALYQRHSSPMLASPGGLRLGRVESAVRLASEALMPDRMGRAEKKLASGPDPSPPPGENMQQRDEQGRADNRPDDRECLTADVKH